MSADTSTPLSTGLKPYPEYRPAAGEWLGELPSHWNVRRMKYVVQKTDSRSTSGKEQLLRVSQYTGVTQRRRADGMDEPDTRAESLVGYKRVEPNDLVVNSNGYGYHTHRLVDPVSIAVIFLDRLYETIIYGQKK